MAEKNKSEKLTYAGAGVDIRAGEDAVERIKHLATATFNEQVLTGLGSFGGMFEPNLSYFEKPVLISSTDSVGTKLKLAFMTGRHDTVGEDLVNHCVNDILVHGARALFFLDYIAAQKVDPEQIAEIVEGISRGCQHANVALIGGETAELSDFYKPKEYDLVGFTVGVVDRRAMITGRKIRAGDVCLGLASSGLHTNGYTLARKIVFDIAGLSPEEHVKQLGTTVADSLMAVHRCYAPVIHLIIDDGVEIRGMAHITGGGIPGNLKRILPESVDAVIHKESWKNVPIFEFLRDTGDLDEEEMYSTFNMGLGYIMVVPPREVARLSEIAGRQGEDVFEIGEIVEGSGQVKMVG